MSIQVKLQREFVLRLNTPLRKIWTFNFLTKQTFKTFFPRCFLPEEATSHTIYRHPTWKVWLWADMLGLHVPRKITYIIYSKIFFSLSAYYIFQILLCFKHSHVKSILFIPKLSDLARTSSCDSWLTSVPSCPYAL